MGNTVTVKPPASLGKVGRGVWRRLQPDYGIQDSGGLVLLETACGCADLEADAMLQARKEGLSTVDRYGQRRPHPLLSVARDARGQMLAALRQLRLDADRPGGY